MTRYELTLVLPTDNRAAFTSLPRRRLKKRP